MSRRPPRLPDPALLGPRPFGDPSLARRLRAAPLCVAVSGGADSTALLHALVRLRAWLGAKPPYGLCAAHFHHGIRGAEADADAAFVADLCARLRVPLETGRGDVPAEAARTGESPAMAARRLRRAFLADVAARAGAEAVATGHTLDDQVELFFLRLHRGAGLGGLGGMAPFAPADPARGIPARLRPLLGARHAALCAFLRDEGLAWREDATNAADDAVRNRIRHRVVPAALDALGPSFPETVARTMAVLRDDAALLDALAARGAEGGAPLERRRVAARLYAEGVDPESVTLDAIERVRELLAAGRNGETPLGGGAVAELSYGALSVRAAGAGKAAAESFVFEMPRELPRGGAAFGPGGALRATRARAVLRPGRGSPLARPAACTVASGAVCGRRLEVRSVRAGDRIRAVGEGHSRKLSDALALLRVPKAGRPLVRVLADAETGEVLWLPGFGVSEAAAVRPGDRILKLTLCDAEEPA